MDIATIIGLAMGTVLLGWAAMAGSEAKFVDWASVAIVFGGGTASVLISFPIQSAAGLLRTLRNAFFTRPLSPAKVIADMVSYAEVARRDGILSLENMTKQIDDDFIVKGIQMAVDGIDPELIEQIMNSELECLAERHAANKSVIDAVCKYAPAYGMIGTLIGLVKMLANMEDPSRIGPGMALAILTTLYGAVVANLFAGPISDKLATRSSEELLLKTIVIKGVMSIQSGDNPRIVEQKLKTFLPPRLRQELEKQEAAR